MKYRIEKDSMGEIEVPDNFYYGAQTQRSVNNFKIGGKNYQMPKEIILSLAYIKKAAARANAQLLPEKMTAKKLSAIDKATDEILNGKLDDNFPLVVFQTGSGTQTNMNLNEVIANRGNEILNGKILHPNDDVNLCQSSNDVMPSALNVSVVLSVKQNLIPSLKNVVKSFKSLETKYKDVIKCGRTHLMDATPVKFSDEISGFRVAIEKDIAYIENALKPVSYLALGGTAVGTGLNATKGFDKLCIKELSQITKTTFRPSNNKFKSLWSRSEIVCLHGALKALSADLIKIANDIRLLASGPRCGIGEIVLPSNEPGSSIMPGKVNPTQCEALTMVCAKVMGNDTTIGFSASQGNFELNVYMPIIAYSVLDSIKLLSEAVNSFNLNCVKGIKVNKEKMQYYLNNSLMLVTALSPVIGYDNAAKIAKKAEKENTTLKKACLDLGLLTEKEFDKIVNPKNMV